MNIYVHGKLNGAYRNGEVLKVIANQGKHRIAVNNYVSCSKKYIIRKISQIVCKKIGGFANFISSDVVYISIMSHNTSLVKIAKLFRKKVITEFYLSFYDTLVRDRKTIREDTKEAIKLYERDQTALLKSDKVILLANADVDYYEKLLNVDFHKVNYSILPIVVQDKVNKCELNFFRGNKEYMQLCWTGTYIPLHGLDKLILAMKIVQEKSDTPIRLMLWGNNEQSAKSYTELIKKNGLFDCIQVHNEWGNLSVWENYIVKNVDVQIGVFGDSDKAKYVMPNKVIDAMSFCSPVITAHSTGVSEFCNGDDDIFIVKNTPEEIADKIIEISKMSFDEIKKRVKNAYGIYQKNFSEKAFSEKFLSLLEEIEN